MPTPYRADQVAPAGVADGASGVGLAPYSPASLTLSGVTTLGSR